MSFVVKIFTKSVQRRGGITGFVVNFYKVEYDKAIKNMKLCKTIHESETSNMDELSQCIFVYQKE